MKYFLKSILVVGMFSFISSCGYLHTHRHCGGYHKKKCSKSGKCGKGWHKGRHKKGDCCGHKNKKKN